MINTITDLTYTTSKVSDDTSVDFKFTKPTGDTPLGGYYLYISTDDTIYIEYDSKIDSIHRRALSLSTYEDEDGYTHFTTIVTEDIYKGRKLYFKMLAVDSVGIVSDIVLRFDSNGGSGYMAPISMSIGETITLPHQTFTYPAYGVFTYWSTEPSSGTTYGDMDSFTMGTTSVTLYANNAAP